MIVIQPDKNAYKKQLQLTSKNLLMKEHLYKNYKDLNDWIMHIGQSQKQGNSVKALIFISAEALQYLYLLQIIINQVL